MFAGVPTILEDIWLPGGSFQGAVVRADAAYPGATYAMFEEEYGVRMVRAEEKLRAILPDEAQAALLQVDAHTPLLSVERVAYTYNDVPMELRRAKASASNGASLLPEDLAPRDFVSRFDGPGDQGRSRLRSQQGLHPDEAEPRATHPQGACLVEESATTGCARRLNPREDIPVVPTHPLPDVFGIPTTSTGQVVVWDGQAKPDCQGCAGGDALACRCTAPTAGHHNSLLDLPGVRKSAEFRLSGMEFPQIQREIAHQAKQKERQGVLQQGQGDCENTFISKAGESHRQAQPSSSGLGAIPPPGGSERDLQSDG
ncbi:hypothetical protein FQA39_LY18997 [Lamprigera yunnana]|nr:hypothetical protein FQA39_LY18997 [Lamprigera yunnana]